MIGSKRNAATAAATATEGVGTPSVAAVERRPAPEFALAAGRGGEGKAERVAAGAGPATAPKTALPTAAQTGAQSGAALARRRGAVPGLVRLRAAGRRGDGAGATTPPMPVYLGPADGGPAASPSSMSSGSGSPASTTSVVGTGRSFLFLQGPHGPFMAELAAALRARGADALRIAFNAGDAGAWRNGPHGDPGELLRFEADFSRFPRALAALVEARGVTDIVLYGDVRPFHAAARAFGSRTGLAVHCFEEGYLRPRWITYERGGVNGNSALQRIPLARMAAAADALGAPLEIPEREGWGAARAHALHGVRYHARARLTGLAWPDAPPHMPQAGWREARAYLRRGLALPALTRRSRAALARLLAPGAPRFHLALLQLGADSSLRAHSRFADVASVVERMIDDYCAAQGLGPGAEAPLVFKAHPFEDGRERLAAVAARRARLRGLADRVHFIDRGPLGPMLDRALSAVTVNSTAAQGALARGLPVLALGESIYARPGLVSGQTPAAFFADPAPPDPAACAALRRFLLATSQIEGDYYTPAGRARAIGPAIDAMLRAEDPYAAALAAAAGRA